MEAACWHTILSLSQVYTHHTLTHTEDMLTKPDFKALSADLLG